MEDVKKLKKILKKRGYKVEWTPEGIRVTTPDGKVSYVKGSTPPSKWLEQLGKEKVNDRKKNKEVIE